jgi:hypothetical protein
VRACVLTHHHLGLCCVHGSTLVPAH